MLPVGVVFGAVVAAGPQPTATVKATARNAMANFFMVNSRVLAKADNPTRLTVMVDVV